MIERLECRESTFSLHRVLSLRSPVGVGLNPGVHFIAPENPLLEPIAGEPMPGPDSSPHRSDC